MSSNHKFYWRSKEAQMIFIKLRRLAEHRAEINPFVPRIAVRKRIGFQLQKVEMLYI